MLRYAWQLPKGVANRCCHQKGAWLSGSHPPYWNLHSLQFRPPDNTSVVGGLNFGSLLGHCCVQSIFCICVHVWMLYCCIGVFLPLQLQHLFGLSSLCLGRRLPETRWLLVAPVDPWRQLQTEHPCIVWLFNKGCLVRRGA